MRSILKKHTNSTQNEALVAFCCNIISKGYNRLNFYYLDLLNEEFKVMNSLKKIFTIFLLFSTQVHPAGQSPHVKYGFGCCQAVSNALVKAIESNDTTKVKELVSTAAKMDKVDGFIADVINVQNSEGVSPILAAVLANNFRLTKLLLDNGARPFEGNKAYRDKDRPYGRTTREIAHRLYREDGEAKRAVYDLVHSRVYDL